MNNCTKPKLLLLSLLLIWNMHLLSQQSGDYSKYEFEDFLATKTTNERDYISVIYKQLTYPDKERENKVEGSIRVQIINHSKGETEVLALTHIGELESIVIDAVSQANRAYLLQTDERFTTELLVDFDMEPFDERDTTTFTLKVLAFKRIECGPLLESEDIPKLNNKIGPIKKKDSKN